MRKIFSTITLSLLAVCSHGRTAANAGDPASYWYAAAERSTTELLNRYWPPMLSRVAPTDDVVDKWHFTKTQDNKDDDNDNYWHQPHALDPIIDAYNRTPKSPEYAVGKKAWLDIIEKWFRGVPRFQYQWNENWAAEKWTSRYPWADTDNAGGWRNHYIDDMEWQVLTFIRVYEALRVDDPALAKKYLATGKDIYDRFIWHQAWDDKAGGVFWMRTDNDRTNSKNACSNGPAMTIAAKLAYYSTGRERRKYERQAQQIYEWMMSNLWSDSGAIADNWNNGRRHGGPLTYNQGTFIGGCHWLYKVTGKEKYLLRAVTATRYSIANFQQKAPDGSALLRSESGPGEENNTVFRAIFLRYFTDMINERAVDRDFPGERSLWYAALETWANYVWREGKGIDKGDGGNDPGGMLFGYDWRKRPSDAEISAGVNLGNMVSGVVLVEAMNIAEDPALR